MIDNYSYQDIAQSLKMAGIDPDLLINFSTQAHEEAQFVYLMDCFDTYERLIYGKLDFALLNDPNTQQLEKYIAALQTLNAYHMQLCCQAVLKNYFWVREVLPNYKGQAISLLRLKEIFYSFYSKFLLNSETMNPSYIAQNAAITSMLFKIISSPYGQKLLINLEALLQDNKVQRTLSLKFDTLGWSSSCPDEIGRINPGLMKKNMEEVKTSKRGTQYVYQGANASYLRMVTSNQLSYGGRTVYICVPVYYGDRLINSYIREKPVIFDKKLPGGQIKSYPLGSFTESKVFMPSFLTFAHELIHALHYFRNKIRGSDDFYTKKIMVNGQFVYTRSMCSMPEESWTISEGNINENFIAREHNLPVLRGVHKMTVFPSLMGPTEQLRLQRFEAINIHWYNGMKRFLELQYLQEQQQLQEKQRIEELRQKELKGWSWPGLISSPSQNQLFQAIQLPQNKLAWEDVKSLILQGRKDFQGANLIGLTFSEFAELSELNFEGANFQDADISDGEFKKINFKNANFKNANMSQAIFENVSFLEANLQNVKINNTRFSRANLYKANCAEGNFKKANFQKVNLQKTDLQRANLADAKFTKADLKEANLQGANLTNAKFCLVDLQGADLRGANLTKVTFKQVNMDGALIDETFLNTVTFL